MNYTSTTFFSRNAGSGGENTGRMAGFRELSKKNHTGEMA